MTRSKQTYLQNIKKKKLQDSAKIGELSAMLKNMIVEHDKAAVVRVLAYRKEKKRKRILAMKRKLSQ